MRGTLELGERPAQAVFDGAIGLALATGVPLRLRGPLTDADLALAVAAVKLGGDGEPAREQLSAEGEIELTLPRPRAGVHLLDLPAPGAVARALWTLSWPLALLGKPSELRLRGPNHVENTPTFHDLRLGWAPLAAQFGLKLSLELTQAGFSNEDGELVASLGQWGADASSVGNRVAQRLGRFLERRGALDAGMAERLLLPSFFCAAGLGARAGNPPSCSYTTSEVTAALVELATLARRA